MSIYNSTFINFYLFFYIIFYYLIIFSNSNLLNHIIRLGDKNYRYNHISFTMKGDMIIDTGAFPVLKVRNFYGITKDGKEFFTDDSGNKNYHSSLYVEDDYGRIEGESYFFRITSNNSRYNGDERLIGISKSVNYKTEIYRFENNTNKISIIDLRNTSSLFGNITSDVFSINRYPSNYSEYIYYISYIVKEVEKYQLKTIKILYKEDLNSIYALNFSDVALLDAKAQRIISCFFTEKKLYICFFINENNNLTIWAYEPNNNKQETSIILTSFKSYGERSFSKGIYFRDEIGFYAYFKYNDTFPTFSLYRFNEDKSITVYKNYSIIQPYTNVTFINYDMLNDLIKFNNSTLCFVSASEEKTILNKIVFSLYDNDNYMNIRYFFIDIWAERIIIFGDLKLGLYNNYLVMAFSHCANKTCNNDNNNNEHFSSLIYFGYANSTTNNSLDIIKDICLNNKSIETDIIINFEKYLLIQNNLFGYVLKAIEILDISDGIKLLKDKEIINPNSTIDKDEKVILNFNLNSGNYKKGNYEIEFRFIITEPDYNTSNQYAAYIDEKLGNKLKDEKLFFKKQEYFGKSSILSIELKEDLTINCKAKDLCSLCYLKNTTECITCRYDYEFNATTNKKMCKENEKPTTIITVKPIDETPEKPTGKPTEEPTENEDIPQTTTIIEEQELLNTNITLCSNNDTLSGKCNIKISNEQLGILYNDLKNKISSNTSEIIMTKNVIFQISSLKEQKNNENPNISSIDLGECEKILKKNLSLNESQELIIFKMDIKSEDLSSTYVQYEIYDPTTLELVLLDACKDIPINIKIPSHLDENTESIYNSLSKSGYNLFDLNDDFYTTNGTDLTLADRKKLIYDSNGDKNMCQEGCIFQFYNSTTKKSDCNCSIQTAETITDMKKINYEKSNFGEEFYQTLNKLYI